MSGSYGKVISNFRRLWQRFRSKLIQDVPEDVQLCEFDCQKLQCAMGDWEKCERRLRSMAQTQKDT
jgi:hypothetical protein